jgi:uncharacterized RDD family membrane protein YckC
LARKTAPKKTRPSDAPEQPFPGFWRRLAAVFYDLILLIALFFVATAVLLPLNSGEAFTRTQFFYPLYLLTVSFIFYGWFWTHGGQTLGLKAWKIRVLTFDQKPVNWLQAFYRFLAALFAWGVFGIGFLWILFDKDKRGWHDHLSKTSVYFDARQK